MGRLAGWLAGALLLAVPGCRSDGRRDSPSHDANRAPPAAAAKPRGGGACDYITASEASAALGQPSRYRPGVGPDSHCILEPTSGNVFAGVSVDYQVSRGASGMRVYDFFAAQKQAEPVAGLGERALWLAAGETRGNLVVVKGATVLSLAISDFSGRGHLDTRARAFAVRVLERL